jgi:high-affinity iron transporter
MYQSGNYQKANQLAITAYLDNYEYLEAPLEKKGYGKLMKEIELLMRVNLRDAIEEKVPQEQLDKTIDEINVKLFDTVGILYNH